MHPLLHPLGPHLPQHRRQPRHLMHLSGPGRIDGTPAARLPARQISLAIRSTRSRVQMGLRFPLLVVSDRHVYRDCALRHEHEFGQPHLMDVSHDSGILDCVCSPHDRSEFVCVHVAGQGQLGCERGEVQAFRLLCDGGFCGGGCGADAGIQGGVEGEVECISGISAFALGCQLVVDGWGNCFYGGVGWDDVGPAIQCGIWVVSWAVVRMDRALGSRNLVVGRTRIESRASMVYQINECRSGKCGSGARYRVRQDGNGKKGVYRVGVFWDTLAL